MPYCGSPPSVTPYIAPPPPIPRPSAPPTLPICHPLPPLPRPSVPPFSLARAHSLFLCLSLTPFLATFPSIPFSLFARVTAGIREPCCALDVCDGVEGEFFDNLLAIFLFW